MSEDQELITMISRSKGNGSIDATFITELKQQIQQLQSIMVAVATGGPRIQDKEAEYVDLYQQVDIRIRHLQSHGVDLAHPNPFRSLWDWYGHWSSELPRYHQRRDYVGHLYDEVLIPLQGALDQESSNPDPRSDLMQVLKLGVYHQTMESNTRTPVEIQDSLRRFQTDHPDPLKTAFIMMRFGSSDIHDKITDTIRSVLLPYGIEGVRADDKTYHDDLFPNVVTYMHGCGFGIAVFERIEADEFNPNVSLEVGYMFALRKSVCLLKDKSIKTLHADLVGKLYSPFDTYDIENTVDAELSRWLRSKGFVS